MPNPFYTLAWCARELRSSIDWGSLLGLGDLGEWGLVAQTQQERLEILHSQGFDPDWSKLLHLLVQGSFWRGDQLARHGCLRLPHRFRGKPSGNGKAATMLADRYGLPVEFIAAGG